MNAFFSWGKRCFNVPQASRLPAPPRIPRKAGGTPAVRFLSAMSLRFGASRRLLLFNRRENLVELVQLGLEQFLIGHLGLVFGNHSGGKEAAERVFDDLFVFGGAEQHADGGIFVGLAVIAVERFEIEVELAQMLGFKAAGFELDGDQRV